MIKKTLALLISVATVGCAGGPPAQPHGEVALVTVDPEQREPYGLLQVHTETVPEFDGDSIPRWLHQPFRIYQDGDLVRTVSNDRETPAHIALPPGLYQVVVPSSDLTVNVEVRDRRLTRVMASELETQTGDREDSGREGASGSLAPAEAATRTI